MSKKSKIAGIDFEKGFDPRRNITGRPNEDRITQIKGEVRQLLAEFFHRFFHTKREDVAKLVDDTQLTLGEEIALRYLLNAARDGDPARMTLLCRIFGIRLEPETQINVNMSLEDLVISANSEMPKEVYINPNERVVETTASKVIVRRGNKDNE